LFQEFLADIPTFAEQLELTVATAKPVVKSGEKQTVALKIGVKGFELESEKQRPPLNIAVVIDRSGSMNGEKIERAKSAAIGAVQQLAEKDIVSVITFDDTVNVVFPASKVSDKTNIINKIKEIRVGGSTALYAGTQKGYEEVKKFYEKGLVNRVIVLSDGLANVGPSSTDDFATLGKKYGGEGISVTTFGLGAGYNEDLMVKLASASDGNHKFIEKADELADIFIKEFNTALSVVAQDVKATVTLPEGFRPVRSLNLDTDIAGQQVKFGWNQIYSKHERFVILEVEIPPGTNGQKRDLANAVLKYRNMETKNEDNVSGKTEIMYSDSDQLVKDSINKPVYEEYIELLANLRNKEAVALRDKGDISGAERAFKSNAGFLNDNAAAIGGSKKLKIVGELNIMQAADAKDNTKWGNTRKGAVDMQNRTANQQGY
jgi:Ca-activated chloride channel family protein